MKKKAVKKTAVIKSTPKKAASRRITSKKVNKTKKKFWIFSFLIAAIILPLVFIYSSIQDGNMSNVLGEKTASSSASIAGYIYNDKNNNGVKDAGEETLTNKKVIVKLSPMKGKERKTTTNKQGFYQFNNLLKGTYTIKIEPPSGYKSTSKNPVREFICEKCGLIKDFGIVSKVKSKLKSTSTN